MATVSEPDIEPPECSICDQKMEFVSGGTQRSVPLFGSEIEYRRFACRGCGQGARFERSDPDEEWQRAGV